jgi:nucleoside-diphosphate-sugar epimerase
VEAGGNRIINQIHRDDAASAFLFLVTANARGIYNVVDDTPLTQMEVYRALAAHFEKPMPPEGPMDVNRKRGWTSKRVSNARLRALGWKPRYRSFFVALKEDPELIEEARS